MANEDLAALAEHLQDDLERLAAQVREAADAVLSRAFPDSDDAYSPKAIIGSKVDIVEIDERAAELDTQRRAAVERVPGAVDALRENGGDALDEDHREALEVAIAIVRPALFMHDGLFDNPVPSWRKILDGSREDIKGANPCVGRIDVPESRHERPYAGTGFAVGENVVITNCHVAKLFSRARDDGRWELRPGLHPQFDAVDDPENRPATAPDPIPIVEVLGIHAQLDLALVRLEAGDGNPEPLTLASEEPDPPTGRPLVVMGYPARAQALDADLQRSIFGDRYGVKRLQPGGLMLAPGNATFDWTPCSEHTPLGQVMFHDASTLGGNSGSCVLDLGDDVVIGAHFGGRYKAYNVAVALWSLQEDPLLASANLNWD